MTTTGPDERRVAITEAESVALLEAAQPGRQMLHLAIDVNHVFLLVDHPGNVWAVEALAEMRA